jgi:hypothetical protein
MRRASRFIAILIVALATLWSMPPGMRAQSGNQAALVIRHGQNDVRTACVKFDEPRISGYELLQKSGFDLQIGVQGLGSLVCSINDTGCPASDCLCQCKGGGECIYWSYWHRLDDSWQYSQGGASLYMVAPGEVEGWSWGPGAVNQAVPPPDISFDEVCLTETVNTSTPSPPATQAVKNTPASLPQQPEETKIPAENLIPPQDSIPVVSTVPEQSSQTAIEEGQKIAGTADTIATSMVVDALTKTPGPIAVVQRVKPGTAETNPGQDAQMIDDPKAELTVPLTLIDEGAVPTVGANLGEPGIADQNSSNIAGSDLLPYLVFLIIVAVLGSLLGFVSFRRKQLK